MKKLTTEQVLLWTKGELLCQGAEMVYTAVGTDSRTIAPGGLFIALCGANFNGNRFVQAALAQGAAAAIVSEKMAVIPGKTLIYVPDTLQALQQIAQGVRRQFTGKVVALTGSVGKTTTKDVLAWCLAQQYPTLKTQVNHNNEIGVPETLLKLEDTYALAVVEMGMRALGEIATLSRIAEPDVVLITNIAPVHLETLQTMENIARAKCEIFTALGSDGWGMLWGDSPLLLATAAKWGRKYYTFGKNPDCDCCLLQTIIQAEGMTLRVRLFDWEGEVFFRIPAEALALDVLAALGCAYRLGMQPAVLCHAIQSYTGDAQRLHTELLPEGGMILNDTYNANPLSMAAALDFLCVKAGASRRVAVLGDMYELGAFEQEGHLQVGRKAAACQLAQLVTIGELGKLIALGAEQAGMEKARIISFAERETARTWLVAHISRQDAVLFKASHGLHLELLLEQWKNGGKHFE